MNDLQMAMAQSAKCFRRACFDPSESTKMWQRMSESEGGGKGINVDFMSTHPANTKRIQVSQVPPLSGVIGKELDLTLLAIK